MRQAKTRRSDRTDEHGGCAVMGGTRWSGRAKPDGFTIIREWHVEQDAGPAHPGRRGIELLEAVDNEEIGLNALRLRGDTSAEAEHDHRRMGGLVDFGALCAADPSAGERCLRTRLLTAI